VEEPLVFDKSLTLLGSGANSTIIEMVETVQYVQSPDYPLPIPNYDYGITLVASNVKISGFTINGTNSHLYLTNYAVDVKSSGVQIIESNLENLYCIRLGGANATLSQNNLRSVVRLECDGNSTVIRGNKIAETNIEVWGNSNEIRNNTISHGNITLGSHGNIVVNNSISHGGITLLKASNNTLEANQLTNGSGFTLVEGSNNTFRENNAEHCSSAFYFQLADFQTRWIDSNILYHNNFINNTQQVKTDWGVFGSNRFDDGKEGNYWSDYNGTDANKDGIGDIPYCTISYKISNVDVNYNEVDNASRQDNFPLMAPFDVENNSVVLPLPEPFPTAIVFSVSVAFAIAVGILISVKKRNREGSRSGLSRKLG
jgi:parallel beta-helix repeat protein